MGRESGFIFGMDAHPKVVNLAEALPEEAWKPLKRLPRYEIVSRPRRKPERVKESIIRFKGYEIPFRDARKAMTQRHSTMASTPPSSTGQSTFQIVAGARASEGDPYPARG